MKNTSYPLNNVKSIIDLKEMIVYCANTFGNLTAFQFERNKEICSINYKEFSQDINALGTILHKSGIQNKKIALIAENCYEWILTYFSVVNGGNIIVPINPDLTNEELIYLFQDTNISAVFVSKKYESIVKELKKKFSLETVIIFEIDLPALILQGKELLANGDNRFINHNINNESCCAILYTSGTVGKPKGVMLSHKNLAYDTVASIKNVLFSGTNLLVLPLYHSFAFTASVLCILLSGKTISINQSLKDLKKDFIRFRPQNLILVPMIVESLYKQIWIQAKKNGKDKILKRLILLNRLLLKFRIDIKRHIFSNVIASFGGQLDFIITGGAPIDQKIVDGFREFGIQVLNGYGITECSPVLAVNRNNYSRDQSVGQILDGVDLKIVDEEIFVRGNVVFSGYYHDIEQTQESFENGWFKTGDLGYIDSDGFLFISGRKKNLIVLSNGKNIYPEELERMLCSITYIEEAIVYQNRDQIEAEVYLVEEKKEAAKAKIDSDVKLINLQLDKYKNITKVSIRDTPFPKTASKKIRRIKNDKKKYN